MKKNPLPEDTRYLNNYLTRYEKFDNSFIMLHLDKVLLMHQPIGNWFTKSKHSGTSLTNMKKNNILSTSLYRKKTNKITP